MCILPLLRDHLSFKTTLRCGLSRYVPLCLWPCSPWISGFLITEPICFRAWAPAFWTLRWESVKTSISLGTILGRHADSCLGAQNAMAPSNSTEPVLVLQESSSRAVSRAGKTSLTPWALSLLITALAVSSAAWKWRQSSFEIGMTFWWLSVRL